jgi:hypothetical protein
LLLRYKNLIYNIFITNHQQTNDLLIVYNHTIDKGIKCRQNKLKAGHHLLLVQNPLILLPINISLVKRKQEELLNYIIGLSYECILYLLQYMINTNNLKIFR